MFRPVATAARRIFASPKLIRGVSSATRSHYRPVFAAGAAFGLVTVGATSAIFLDVPTAFPAETTVTVEQSISPFPTALSPEVNPNLTQSFSLLGHGVRYVTFLKFKVYGIGVYIADADVAKARSIVSDALGARADALSDPQESANVVQKLLDNHVRFAVRICPVRNTDYSHLKDGLIKSTLAHPMSKEHRDAVGAGLDELRQVFQGRKGSVPKNHLLFLEVLQNGSLLVSYEDPKRATVVPMGTMSEPLVGQILMLQYLSGKKPLSEELRKLCGSRMEVM